MGLEFGDNISGRHVAPPKWPPMREIKSGVYIKVGESIQYFGISWLINEIRRWFILKLRK